MNAVQLGLPGLADPTAPPPARPGVLVRSHIRHIGGPAPVPHNGTETSKQAAKAVRAAGTDTTQKGRILALLIASRAEGMTRSQLANASGVRESTVGPRVAQLIREGKAVETGTTRHSSFGVPQKVVYAGEAVWTNSREPLVFCCPQCREITFRSALYLIAGQFYLTVRSCPCGYREVA